MINTQDLLNEYMNELGYIPIEHNFIYKNGKKLDAIYVMYEQMPSRGNAIEVSEGIFLCPGGFLVKRFEIIGRIISWEHQDKEFEVDLADPESLDMIYEYVIAEE